MLKALHNSDMPRRRNQDDGWTYEETPGVGQFRWKVLPERVDSLIRDTSEDITLGDDGRVLVAEE